MGSSSIISTRVFAWKSKRKGIQYMELIDIIVRTYNFVVQYSGISGTRPLKRIMSAIVVLDSLGISTM
jgi:hypothetical protein